MENKSEEMKQELKNNVLQIAEQFSAKPEDIIQFLKFKENFYNYSSRNSLLIFKQNPGAILCNSYKSFEKMGYNVLKGQRGMKILVPTKKTYLNIDGDLIPLSQATKQQKEALKKNQIESIQKLFFKVGTVFDITQTNCPKSDYPKYLDIGYTSEQHADIYKSLKNYCETELNCKVYENKHNSVALRGFYSPDENLISISGIFNDTTRLSILSHETAHAVMNHSHSSELSEAQIEFEADATSIMLHNHFGLEVAESRKRHIYDVLSNMKKTADFKPELITQSLEKSHEAFKKISTSIKNQMTLEHINKPNQISNVATPQQTPTANTVLPNQIPTQNSGFSQSMN